MPKAVSVSDADKVLQEIFFSSKNKSLYNVDFTALDRAGKIAYIKDFLNRDVFFHQIEPIEVMTNPQNKKITYNASRQVGKTLISTTYVTLANGNVIQIKDLPKNDSFFVSTIYNNKVTIVPAILIESGMKPVFENRFFSSEPVTTSDDHKFYRRKTIRKWKKGSCIYDGYDYCRSADLIKSDHIGTIRNLEALVLKEDYKISDDEIIILAYHLADGGYSKNEGPISFTKEDTSISGEYKRILETLGDELIEDKNRKTKAGNAVQYRVKGHKFRALLTTWGLKDKDCYEKYIPDFVFQFSKRQIGLFLNRFLACDGYACIQKIGRPEIGTSLCNKRMIMQLSNLLRMLGISVAVRHGQSTCTNAKGGPKKFPRHTVCITKSTENYILFRDTVNIFTKEENVQKALDICNSEGVSYRYEHSLEGDIRYAFFQSREPAGEAFCYDLAITAPPVEAFGKDDYEQNFIANGIIVHNSESMSWAQVICAINNTHPALDGKTKIVGIANKFSQTQIIGNRVRNLLNENYNKTKFFWDREGSSKFHVSFKKEAGLNTIETGTIDYVTSNPKAFSEGHTASIIFVDEANRLDPTVFSETILPYLGSSNGSLVLTGVSRGKGPFYDTCNSKDYVHLHYPWDKVETYQKNAPVDILHKNGRIQRVGLYPLEVMPLSLKKVLFPDNPKLHILPFQSQKESWIDLWNLSLGSMAETDFRSQYILEWCSAEQAFLTLNEQILLFEQGDYEPLQSGISGEEYWYGFDPAGAENVYASGNHVKDKAALAIYRKRNGKKEKVFCDELYSAQPDELISWLQERVNPVFGRFKCRYGSVDITGAVGAFISERLQQSGLPVIPILYNRTEPTTSKNYKNAMFQYFKMENIQDRVRYPRKEFMDDLDENTLQPKYPCWNNCKEEWDAIEIHDNGGPNAKIQSFYEKKDDHCNADVLCVFTMDRPADFNDELQKFRKRGTAIRTPGLQGNSPANQMRQQTARTRNSPGAGLF